MTTYYVKPSAGLWANSGHPLKNNLKPTVKLSQGAPLIATGQKTDNWTEAKTPWQVRNGGASWFATRHLTTEEPASATIAKAPARVGPNLEKIYAEVMEWAKSVEGKWVDEDGAYGAQCVDPVNNYARVVHNMPYSPGNGVDKATNFARDYGWEFVPGDEPAQPGDVASANAASPWHPKYGHTWVVLKDYVDTQLIIDQNPNATRIREIRKAQIKGYARPTRFMATTVEDVSVHVVQGGDSFWSIAQAYDVDLTELIAANAKVDPENMQIGSAIVIP